MSTTNEATLLEKSADILRTLPLAAGAMGVVAVVLNRAVFGVRAYSGCAYSAYSVLHIPLTARLIDCTGG